jgi:hypothetical protein
LVVVREAALLEQAEEGRENFWREKSGEEDDGRGIGAGAVYFCAIQLE